MYSDIDNESDIEYDIETDDENDIKHQIEPLLSKYLIDNLCNIVLDYMKETCTGCIDGHLNQLAHMDFGGCLYDEPYECSSS